jgi:hypothetical protein
LDTGTSKKCDQSDTSLQMNHLSAKLMGQDNAPHFSHLHKTEQTLIVPKLLGLTGRSDFAPEEYAQAATIFHRLLAGEEERHLPKDRFLTLRNFICQMGAMPVAWAQVKTIVGVACSYLEMTVHDHHQFLAALKAEGFAVNSWMEKVSRLTGHGHRFDSARARTEHRFEPQLHLVNDRADEELYGPNYFFVHWDAQSVYARRGWLFGRIAAGRTHAHQTATPQQVEEYLARITPCHDQHFEDTLA